MRHPAIIRALVAAKQRGVDILLVLDVKELDNNNIVAQNLGRHADIRWFGDGDSQGQYGQRLHAKVLIVDRSTCITGSGNPSLWTERTIEDIVIFSSTRLDDLAVILYKREQFASLWQSLG
jgi:phosphatidylserine/phosphatidylglycerophosphate/cardiolipin synthase-like enzyme